MYFFLHFKWKKTRKRGSFDTLIAISNCFFGRQKNAFLANDKETSSYFREQVTIVWHFLPVPCFVSKTVLCLILFFV